MSAREMFNLKQFYEWFWKLENMISIVKKGPFQYMKLQYLFFSDMNLFRKVLSIEYCFNSTPMKCTKDFCIFAF